MFQAIKRTDDSFYKKIGNDPSYQHTKTIDDDHDPFQKIHFPESGSVIPVSQDRKTA